ncbi:MAG: glycosyltransferase family 4 protein, partial [Bacteroidota bacterium]|nr:glycosyltransferase family 4 protein [Bacteroidota bacterium]
MRIANVVLNDFTRDNRVLKVSESLARVGHDVTVVALLKEGFPMEEERGTWNVVRTRIATSALPRGTVFGVLKMAELALRVVWRWRKVDAWHCNDIEAFVLGWCAQRLNPRLRLIYDCHEFEAERNAKPAIERKMVGWLERRMIRKAEAVITVSPSIAAAYRERYARHGLPEVHLVRNIP